MSVDLFMSVHIIHFSVGDYEEQTALHACHVKKMRKGKSFEG